MSNNIFPIPQTRRCIKVTGIRCQFSYICYRQWDSVSGPLCLNSHLVVAFKGSAGMVCPHFKQIGDKPAPTLQSTVRSQLPFSPLSNSAVRFSQYMLCQTFRVCVRTIKPWEYLPARVAWGRFTLEYWRVCKHFYFLPNKVRVFAKHLIFYPKSESALLIFL